MLLGPSGQWLCIVHVRDGEARVDVAENRGATTQHGSRVIGVAVKPTSEPSKRWAAQRSAPPFTRRGISLPPALDL